MNGAAPNEKCILFLVVFFFKNLLLPPPNGEDYVFISVGLEVYLFGCLSVSNITGKRSDGFKKKNSGYVGRDNRNNL